MSNTCKVNLYRTPIVLQSSAEVTLVTEVEDYGDGNIKLYFSHTGKSGRDSAPWFSDSLSSADSLEDALCNIRAIADHIQACHEVVIWDEDLGGR